MSVSTYKRRVMILTSLDAVHNHQYDRDWAIAALYVPEANAVGTAQELQNLQAINGISRDLLNDEGDITMELLDPSVMSDDEFIEVWEALERIAEAGHALEDAE